MKLFRICIVPIILALIGSCFTVPRYSVKVNSFSRDYDISHKVIIVPLDKNLSANDLQFIEFSKHVTKALEKNGFQVVTDFNDANVIVTLYYSISAPISQTLSIPQFGPTGIESSTPTRCIPSPGSPVAAPSPGYQTSPVGRVGTPCTCPVSTLAAWPLWLLPPLASGGCTPSAGSLQTDGPRWLSALPVSQSVVS